METHFTTHPEDHRQGDFADAPVPRPGSGARVWAGAVIVTGGLGLIVLGGCFLYGVLELLRQAGAEASPAGSTLLVILYVMAFACFMGAAVLLAVGLWGLARILLERPSPPGSEG
jgi:hypothetical protein